MTDEELLEHINNVRKCLNKASRIVVPEDGNDDLIDLINHMDAICQQIENEIW